MKILVCCDQGNNRSVTLAGQLKYLGHDVLSAGLFTNSAGTLMMLEAWADKIIITDPSMATLITNRSTMELRHIGPDIYPRPYNSILLRRVKQLIAEHPEIRSEVHD